MVTKERLPTLRGRSPPPCHILGDAGLAEVDPKLEQFAVNPGRTPQRIGDADLADQLPDLDRYRGTPRPALRFPAPIGLKARSMPAQYCRRPNDRQRAASVREQPTNPTEHQPVHRRKRRSLRPQPPQHIDLLSQSQNLCLQTGSRPEQINHQSKNQPEEIQHQRRIVRLPPNGQPVSFYDGDTKEAALLQFNSVRITVSTICRVSFVCAQARIEAE